jgi:NADPH-dependent ferric siderophore reductase
MNSITRTPIRVRHVTKLRLVQVVRADELSPCMRRVVLGGEALDGFTSAAADDHVKLFFPAPRETQPVLPGADGAAPIMRDYTPRRFDPAARELTIDFVVHGDGPASTWAEQAASGQWLGVGGPRGSFLPPEDYDAYLLVGDQTALPAIARRLEEMPAGVRAIALIEVADDREQQALPTAANATVTWLHRDGTAPGTSRLLDDALAALAWPGGDVHAWLAGEIDTVRRLRSHLVEVRGLARTDIRAAGYWRIGEADAHSRLED